MKRFVLFVLLMIQMVNGAAFAQEVNPNATDDPAWQAVLTGKSLKIPDGFPTGPGAVRRVEFDGMKKNSNFDRYVPNEDVVIDRPIKMGNTEEFSAIQVQFIYRIADQIEKQHLNIGLGIIPSSSNEMRQLDNRKQNVINFAWYTKDINGNDLELSKNVVHNDKSIIEGNDRKIRVEDNRKAISDRLHRRDNVGGSIGYIKLGEKREGSVFGNGSIKGILSNSILSADHATSSYGGERVLDAQKQWQLISAILSVPDVPIESIRMPAKARADILKYAIDSKAPDKLVQTASRKIEVVSIPLEAFQGIFMQVRLGCSLRDRLLGCKGDLSKEKEELLTRIVNAAIKQSAKQDDSHKYNALLLASLSRAHNVDLSPVRSYVISYTKKSSEAIKNPSNYTQDEIKMIRTVQNAKMLSMRTFNESDDINIWRTELNKQSGSDLLTFSYVMSFAPKMTPRWSKNFYAWFKKLTKETSRKFILSSIGQNVILAADDPKILPELVNALKDEFTKKLEKKSKSSSFNVKVWNSRLENIISFISISEVPSSLDYNDRIKYWENIVSKTSKKTKEDLIFEALRNQKIIEKIDQKNIFQMFDEITEEFDKIERFSYVLALNVHAYISKKCNASIPVYAFREKSKKSNVRSNKMSISDVVGNKNKLIIWWKSHRKLYIPVDNSKKFSFDLDEVMRHYFLLLNGHIMRKNKNMGTDINDMSDEDIEQLMMEMDAYE